MATLLPSGSAVKREPLPIGAGPCGYACGMGRATPEDRALAANVTAHILEAMARDGLSQNEVARRAGVGSGRLSRFMTAARVAVPPSFLIRLARAIGSNPSRILTAPPDDKRFLELARRRQVTTPSEGISAQ